MKWCLIQLIIVWKKSCNNNKSCYKIKLLTKVREIVAVKEFKNNKIAIKLLFSYRIIIQLTRPNLQIWFQGTIEKILEELHYNILTTNLVPLSKSLTSQSINLLHSMMFRVPQTINIIAITLDLKLRKVTIPKEVLDNSSQPKPKIIL